VRALLAAAAGDDDAAEEDFERALAAARSGRQDYWLAALLHDYGRWLLTQRRTEQAASALGEARGGFEGMGATQWLELIDAVDVGAGTATRS
jgi:Tfp pilus assembly protein PilF